MEEAARHFGNLIGTGIRDGLSQQSLGLGTVFSLACPFTLLAHYTELEWAEACGVSRYLIRLSVGLEDPEELWKRLQAALEGNREQAE